MSPKGRTRLSQLGEFEFVSLVSGMANCKNAIKGIGDDTAVLPSAGPKKCALLTTDMLAEGVHFTKTIGPENIGRKALACSLSDIAAMGGRPKYAVVSLGVPGNLKVEFAKGIVRGMNRLAKKFHVDIVGGDTISSKKIIVNVALLGEAGRKDVVLRAGAKRGDFIFVTGSLGRSAKTGKHYSFLPRIKEAQFLVRNFKPTAMIDISDGLIADLYHILDASKVSAFLYEEMIPKAPKATLAEACYDGEDFELLFTLSSQKAKKLMGKKNIKDTFFCVGQIKGGGRSAFLVDVQGRKKFLKKKGYTHF